MEKAGSLPEAAPPAAPEPEDVGAGRVYRSCQSPPAPPASAGFRVASSDDPDLTLSITYTYIICQQIIDLSTVEESMIETQTTGPSTNVDGRRGDTVHRREGNQVSCRPW